MSRVSTETRYRPLAAGGDFAADRGCLVKVTGSRRQVLGGLPRTSSPLLPEQTLRDVIAALDHAFVSRKCHP